MKKLKNFERNGRWKDPIALCGKLDPQADMLCRMSPEKFVPQDPPLRAITPFVDEALRGRSSLFDEMYAEIGWPSIPPERLLKAKLLPAFYTLRSEALLVEMLHDNLFFRWFLDRNLTDEIGDNSTFTVNQQRQLDHDPARLFFHTVAAQAREQGWMSDTHFTVDGTLGQAWASLKSFAPKEAAAKKTDDDPGNPSVDFKGGQRRNGRVQLVYRGQPLKWRALPEGSVRKPPPAPAARKVKTKPAVKPPAASQPWRRDGVGAGRQFWNRIKARGRAVRLGLRDSGRGNEAANNNQPRGHSLAS